MMLPLATGPALTQSLADERHEQHEGRRIAGAKKITIAW